MTDFRPGRFQVLPTVVKNLIIINVIMVLLQFALIRAGINLADILGLHYWASPLFRWWQPVTHMFMHGDPYDLNMTFWHILSNMFALWMFGRILENMWGPRKFLIFYFVCGLGAALCHMAVLTYQFQPFQQVLAAYQQNPSIDAFLNIGNHFPVRDPEYANQFLQAWRNNPGSLEYISQSADILKTHMNEATVGASGAVFGVLFAFGYLFPNAELMLLFPPIPLKAKWLVGLYALFELYAGINNSAGDNIAHFAHLGGMLFAFILLRIWKQRSRNRFY
jgi:membrane associated rhomboid family serine protease